MSKKYTLRRNPRLPQQREADLALTARYYLRGYGLKEIAERLSKERPYQISLKTIGRDLQELHNRWLNSSLVDINAAKQQELERLRLLEEAYWQAWERSTAPMTESETESVVDTQGVEGQRNYTRDRTKTKQLQRDGSAQYLQGIERCIEMRCKILGLNAPKQINFKGDWREAAKEAGIPENEAAQQFETLAQSYYDALAKNSPA